MAGSSFAGMPSWAWLALGAGASAAANMYSSKKAADAEKEMSAEDRALKAQDLALQESQLNPFRHQAAQAGTAAGLDLLANGTYTPVTIDAGKYSAYVPKISGGFSYQKSPELVSGARQLERDVLAGHTAPTMTDPTNYGKTAALNTLAGTPGAAGQPGSALPRSGQPSLVDDFNDLTMSYDRRGGGTGGVGRGAVSGLSTGASVGSAIPGVGTAFGAGAGLVGGAIIGAATKHAKSAPTDFRVQDAVNVIRDAYARYQGRTPAPEEITRMLQGQGWQPGDRFVGQDGLMALVSAIANQAAA